MPPSPALVEHVLAVLRGVDAGSLDVLISPGTRVEQFLEPTHLDAATVTLIKALLDAPRTADAITAVLASTEVADPETILDNVVRRPSSPIWLEREFNVALALPRDAVTWRLDRIAIGLTGAMVHASIIATWPADIDYTAFPKPMEHQDSYKFFDEWWTTVDEAQFSDDVVGLYELGQRSIDFQYPFAIQCAGSRFVRASQHYTLSYARHATSLPAGVKLLAPITIRSWFPNRLRSSWDHPVVDMETISLQISVDEWSS
jgi:hypothetical protein